MLPEQTSAGRASGGTGAGSQLKSQGKWLGVGGPSVGLYVPLLEFNQLEDLDLQAKSAEANYQQALAVRENAKINLDRTTVYTPVNGYVTNLVVDEGDFADVNSEIICE
jgi:multidrug efflux pump subunit AcrA (membrane-fusion protein)